MFFFVLGIITAAYLALGVVFLGIIMVFPQVRTALLAVSLTDRLVEIPLMVLIWPFIAITIYKEGLPS